MKQTTPKQNLSVTKESGASVVSDEQHSKMANSCDQMGTRVEAREAKLLGSEAAGDLVAIQKNKTETVAAYCCSLQHTSSSFPCRLMKMINWCESEQADKEGVSLLIGWSVDGKYFTINDREKLSEHVLRRFFKDSKFESFQRKLYRWGFKQVPSKRDSSGIKHGIFSFYVDGFERDSPNSSTKLKVRYSTKEEYERRQKSLKAKLNKMEKKSNAGNNLGRYKGKPKLELSPPAHVGIVTPCNRVVPVMDYSTHPRGTCASAAHLEIGHAGGASSIFSEDASANDIIQVALLADMVAQRQSEQRSFLLPLRQEYGVSPTGNFYSGTSSASSQLGILYQQSLILSRWASASRMLDLRTMEERKVALQRVCHLRNLQQLTDPLSCLQMCSSIPGASLGLSHYPIAPAQPSLPQVYPAWSAFTASKRNQT
jgi:hypothetical protein